ncbi:zinc finger BED domain-containing protein 4 [Elysia marginata]|uniref:Zinc finger BED domain-containing protein 4 n=1 Tax=Elysia marginata TaxID=1093978 RepID=A0AAV4HHN0_9GAST|nr:zinc finger BED domain-containing protein 4 [Elysia marginata]
MKKLSPRLVECQLCGSKFRYNNSTSVLRKHVLVKHPDQQDAINNYINNGQSDAKSNHETEAAVSKITANLPNKFGLIEENNDLSHEPCYQVEVSSTANAKSLVLHGNESRKRSREYYRDSEIEDRHECQISLDAEDCGLKRKTVSVVWRFMVKRSPSETSCTLCMKTFRYCKGGTSGMLKHLKLFHAEILERVQAEKLGPTSYSKEKTLTSKLHPTPAKSLCPPSSLNGRAASAPSYSNNKNNSSEIKNLDCIVNLLIKDLYPYSFIETESFQKVLHTLNPKALTPTKKKVEADISILHQKYKNILQMEINEAPGISLSTEVWTYRPRRQYLTVTGHFLSKDWERRTVVLKTVLLDTRTSSDLGTNIAHNLAQILKDWAIHDKVTCIVTDHSEPMAAAVARLKVPHLQCIAHALNLLVETSLKLLIDIENVAERVRGLVDFCDYSADVSQKLNEMQAMEGKESQKLTLDTESDWMSTYRMLKSYLELHSSLRSVLQSEKQNMADLLLLPSELELLSQCLEVLKPFALAVEDMASDDHTALSKSVPILQILQQMMSSHGCPDPSKGDKGPLSILSTELNQQLDHIYNTSVRNDANPLSFTATLLDPRFKTLILKDPEALECVENKLRPLIGTVDSVESESLTTNIATSDIDTDSLWLSFDRTVKKSVCESPVNELHRYYEERQVTRHENPLLYWKAREVSYPELANVVKMVLSIPATCVPSKQVFFGEEKKKTVRRTFLEEKSLDSILFLNTSQITT